MLAIKAEHEAAPRAFGHSGLARPFELPCRTCGAVSLADADGVIRRLISARRRPSQLADRRIFAITSSGRRPPISRCRAGLHVRPLDLPGNGAASSAAPTGSFAGVGRVSIGSVQPRPSSSRPSISAPAGVALLVGRDRHRALPIVAGRPDTTVGQSFGSRQMARTALRRGGRREHIGYGPSTGSSASAAPLVVPGFPLVVIVGLGMYDYWPARRRACIGRFVDGPPALTLVIVIFVVPRRATRRRAARAICGAAALLSTVLEARRSAIAVKDETAAILLHQTARWSASFGRRRSEIIRQPNRGPDVGGGRPSDPGMDAAARRAAEPADQRQRPLIVDGKSYYYINQRQSCEGRRPRLLIVASTDITAIREAEAGDRACRAGEAQTGSNPSSSPI